MKVNNKIISRTVIAGAVAVLTSCAATQTALEHRNLEVGTKQSQTIFLEPVSQSQKTVFVAVKNTSDEEINITAKLKTTLQTQGYQVLSQPDRAHYLLQANILKVGKMSVAASQSALGTGYGSALAGAAVGTAAGSFANSGNAMIAGGLAGGVIGLAADSLVKDVNYTMITDVQISERVGKGKVVENFNASLQNGTSSGTYQTSSKQSDYQRYRTRIVSNADKVNLKFNEARGALEQGLVKAISGIF